MKAKLMIQSLIAACIFLSLASFSSPGALGEPVPDCQGNYDAKPQTFKVDEPYGIEISKKDKPNIRFSGFGQCKAEVIKVKTKQSCTLQWTGGKGSTPPKNWRLMDNCK